MLQEEDAGAEIVVAEKVSPVMSGFSQFMDNASEGDFSGETWLLLWESVGQPVLLAIILLLAVLLLASWASKLTGRAVRRCKVEETLARFLSALARYLVLIAGGVAILGTLGVETTSFAAVIAAVGFAIGLAMSGMLGNIAAGVMLLFFRPLKVGDFVDAAGVKGTVYEIGLFLTQIDTFDNKRIVVPNSSIFGDNITNFSYHATRRVDVAVGTEYSADIDKTREVLERVANEFPDALEDPAPAVALLELGGSSINWEVRVWTKSDIWWPSRQKLTRDVKVALDQAGIGIPFPQMDVHIDGAVKRE